MCQARLRLDVFCTEAAKRHCRLQVRRERSRSLRRRSLGDEEGDHVESLRAFVVSFPGEAVRHSSRTVRRHPSLHGELHGLSLGRRQLLSAWLLFLDSILRCRSAFDGGQFGDAGLDLSFQRLFRDILEPAFLIDQSGDEERNRAFLRRFGWLRSEEDWRHIGHCEMQFEHFEKARG